MPSDEPITVLVLRARAPADTAIVPEPVKPTSVLPLLLKKVEPPLTVAWAGRVVANEPTANSPPLALPPVCS